MLRRTYKIDEYMYVTRGRQKEALTGVGYVP